MDLRFYHRHLNSEHKYTHTSLPLLSTSPLFPAFLLSHAFITNNIAYLNCYFAGVYITRVNQINDR